MASLRAQLMRAVTGRYFQSIKASRTDVQAMRRRWHTLAHILPVARGVARRGAHIAGLKAEWLTPDGAARDKALLYLHGGAYVMGNCSTHRQLASHIARAAGVPAVLPEYRLAPEHPFPAAVNDAIAAYRALLAMGFSPEDIVIAGDSAGGGLSMSMLLALRDAGDALPRAACLLSPWLDLAGSGESMRTRAGRDPWFRPEFLPLISRYYCDETELRNPLVSPVYANLSNLPPLYIQVGDDELLLSDSTRIAEAARSAGVDVELEVWPDMWHVFQAFMHQVPESRKAIRKIGAYMRRALADEAPAESES
ncbi:MAG: alpha/beta hydrolase [Woeseiaceae bacterium]|jgi:monoterpene epsilon-lactone hydrolase